MTPFEALLDQYPRIGIAGGPRTGKSTLSQAAAQRRPVIGTDRYMHDMSFEDVPYRLIDDVRDLKTYVAEGVQVGRAVRRGLPVDALVYLDEPKAEQTTRQASMSKAVLTVLKDWAAKAEGDLPPVFVRGQDGGFVSVPARELFGSGS